MINVAGLVGDSIVDGPGMRLTVFCQGCPHHCPGCHNADTWPFEGGTPMEEASILKAARDNPLIRGITFSGGEPMCQAEGFARLGTLLRRGGYEIACYTGYTFEELIEKGSFWQRELLKTLDVLIDGPYLEDRRDLKLCFRGSSNQRVLDVPESLRSGAAVETALARWRGQY